MIPRFLVLILAAALPAAAAAAQTPGPAPRAGPASSYDRYRVLSERNIFLRNRSAPRRERSGGSPPSAAPSAREYHVLTGVLQLAEDGIAFFEDTRTRETVRVAPGDKLGGGTVTLITLTGLTYERDGAARTIVVGEDLAGVAVTAPAPVAAKPTVPPAAASSSPPRPPDAGRTRDSGRTRDGDRTRDADRTPATPQAAQGEPPSQTETKPAGASDDAAAILERMRQRREQELRQ